jgi:hypothetical protein
MRSFSFKKANQGRGRISTNRHEEADGNVKAVEHVTQCWQVIEVILYFLLHPHWQQPPAPIATPISSLDIKRK